MSRTSASGHHECGERVCMVCGKPAASPMMPLCLGCDLDRLQRGKDAAEVRQAALAHFKCFRCGGDMLGARRPPSA